MKPIALQLYSLRKDVYAGGDDLPGVIRTLAEIGYKGVELAGLHGNDPRDIGKLVSDLGMQVCSAHAGMPSTENVKALADEFAALGTKMVVGGFGPDNFKTLDAVKKTADEFQKAAEVLKPYGMSFGFHNHWWEFEKIDGKFAYDILMAERAEFFSELDTYWTAFGHADPVEIVSRHKARLPLLHIKDGMLEEGKHTHTAVGSGKMNMPAVIGAADPDVLEWLIVELDACDTDMLEAVKQSHRYLTSHGLALGD